MPWQQASALLTWLLGPEGGRCRLRGLGDVAALPPVQVPDAGGGELMPNTSQIQCLSPTWCPLAGPLLYPVGRFFLLLPSLGQKWAYGEPIPFPHSLTGRERGGQPPTSAPPQTQAPQHGISLPPQILLLRPGRCGYWLGSGSPCCLRGRTGLSHLFTAPPRDRLGTQQLSQGQGPYHL